MAAHELHNFMYKFHHIWSHGRRANLTVSCEEGYAWVTLSTDLGPWRHPPRSRPTPRPPRPTRTTPSPKSPGNSPPGPPVPPPLPPSSPVPSVPPAAATVIPPKRTPTPTQQLKRKWSGTHSVKPIQEALFDEAWSERESLGQVDGIVDSPLERPGRSVEVEGEMLEEEERSMTGWCLVRRKGGQEEKVVSAVSRGWEEYKKKFPHLVHEQRPT